MAWQTVMSVPSFRSSPDSVHKCQFSLPVEDLGGEVRFRSTEQTAALAMDGVFVRSLAVCPYHNDLTALNRTA